MSKLNLRQRKTLQLLSCFLVYIGDHHGGVDLDVIMGLEKAEYQDFCLTKAYYYINTTIAPSGQGRTTETGTMASSTPQHLDLITFQKSIKKTLPFIQL